ncbi:glycosyltransferase family 2 protein [Tunturiibacter empetritectus]|uniref:Cellulose synthase/poly-beta-1,6-N-acetylglucosamine synthase-like glycosyltransferase n=2 Tax=Tunturiibacter TaxID=3154218 RepID=A0A852VH19_9BACT|nr:cellulose synthase/poly-beta-1,6-N-acetylglucosamine synthase-like glycosyltransferase [Edaphobacter lichenicola]
MKFIFWICLALTGYAYFGYAVLLSICVYLRKQSIRKADYTPGVSIIMAARNEEVNLPSKLENLRMLNYPKEQFEIVVASDGSTDRTAEILLEQSPPVVAILLEESGGKARALNAAVSRARGEILVFLDARQSLELNAISELACCFADPTVGAVSGELLLENSGVHSHEGLGIYWKIEKMVRKLESASGSVVGVTGAIYAIRRELYVAIPPGAILDDVFVPMNVARQGKRVVFEPAAIARDRFFNEKGKEFSRKVRTLTGNYQLLQLAPWLLSPSNPLLFRFVSHKLLRLLIPIFLPLMLVASGVVGGPFYGAIFWLQVLFYVAAACGSLIPSAKRFKPVGIASTFVMLNAAAALAFFNFAAGRKKVWL